LVLGADDNDGLKDELMVGTFDRVGDVVGVSDGVKVGLAVVGTGVGFY
jgi:hypothetical protein